MHCQRQDTADVDEQQDTDKNKKEAPQFASCKQNLELITKITVNIEIKRQEQFAKKR